MIALVALLLLVVQASVLGHTLNSTSTVPIQFGADLASGKSTRIRTPILNCVGSGHASLSLRSDYREHMRNAARDIGFKYVRFHGILDDDMSTFLNGHANLYNVFNSLDFFLANGVKPIVELGFMPELLATNASQTTFHYEGGISAPKDWAAWGLFIGEVVQGMVDHYGTEEVRTWRFEVWNEPNCGFYVDQDCCGPDCGNQPAYFELYRNTAAAVKLVDKYLQVGGPATAQLAWIPEFIAFTRDNSVAVDFISTHLYPTDPFLPMTADGFMDAIAESAALAATINVPLVMTEFNSGLGVPGYDGPFAAAAVFHQHLASQAVENMDTLSFWTFSDVFEEQGLISSPYYEASPKFGIQTLFGVPKPSYRAFEFIAHQPKMAVPVSALKTVGSSTRKVVQRKAGLTIGTIDAMISATEQGQFTHVEAIFGNYNMSWQPILTEEVEVLFTIPANAIVPDVGTLEVIDSTHAFAMPVWLAAGSPLYPTQKEVSDELAASKVVPQVLVLQHVSPTQVKVQMTMEAYALMRVRFDYQMP